MSSHIEILMATAKRFRQEGDACIATRGLDFDDVYTRHFEFACRSLRLLGVEPHAVEDAAQDVFGVVARRLVDFEPNASVTTWIFAIASRVAANHRRSRRRTRDRLEALSEPLFAADSPDAHADAARTARLIQSFAIDLDEERRVLLVLGVLERVPARELVKSLGIPLFTVYSRIRSVRDGLKAFLKEHGVSA